VKFDKYGINAGCIEGIDMFALRPILIEGIKGVRSWDAYTLSHD
jgi:hypothetical protein